MDGAFFPQPDFQVPKEKMSQHARYYVMMPAGVLSHLILVHSQLGFGLFKALLDGPAQSAEPDKGWQPCTDRCIADEIVIFGIAVDGSADDQPDLFLRQARVGKFDPATSKLVGDRTFGALGNFAPIPEV